MPSAYVFVCDLLEEGVDTVLGRLTSSGIDRVELAVAYHRARDVTPRSRTRLTWREDGVHFAAPWGSAGLQPPVAGSGAEALVSAIRDRGLAVGGWTVTAHSTTLGQANPHLTRETAFGGRESPADLCPAQEQVRRYVVDLAVAVARLGVDRVVVESLHHGHHGHGYHHERSFVVLGPVEQFLLSLCFCPACSAAAAAAGADVDRARHAVRVRLDAVLAGGPISTEPLEIDRLAQLSPDLLPMLRSRTATVTDLVADVSAAVVAAGSRLGFIDLSGALLGYADGRPQGALAAHTAWRSGIDPATVASRADYHVLAYACDVARVSADVGAYRAVIGSDAHLRAVLRPTSPDTVDAAQLGDRVTAALDAGADDVDFYAYGLATDADLARIPSALGRSRAAR